MGDWSSCTLDEVIDLQRGHDLPSTIRGDGDVPVIGSFGITGFHDVAKYPGPGVAIGRSGASIGVATFCASEYWPLNTCLFVKNFKRNDPRWVFYLLDSIDFSGFNSGSAQPSLNRNYLKSIPILLPSLVEQQAIAGVLSALDDKIESNRRLQELCMSLASSEHGFWRGTVDSFIETTFGDFCDVFGGATPSTEEPSYWGGEFAWLTPTDVTALDAPYLFATSRTLTEEGLRAASTRLHPKGTVFMTSRATIGAFAVAQIPCSTNQGFIAVQPHQDSHRWFIFHEMKSRVQLMFDLSSGSTFRELSRGTFKNMAVSIPSSEADFDRLAAVLEPLHSKASNASQENLKLSALRDTLLPELLSGRLRVRDTESMMENV